MTVSSLNADRHPVLAAAGAVSTGSGEYLAYWLAQRAKKDEPATVFVTLDSLPRIEEIQHSDCGVGGSLVDGHVRSGRVGCAAWAGVGGQMASMSGRVQVLSKNGWVGA